MRPGKIETYARYSQFTSLQDFNKTICNFLAVHRKVFTPAELIAFKRLVRFCAKYPGVANAKVATVVAACTEVGGVSRSTYERMLRKARKLGIVEVHHTVREKGGFAHNVYVFQRFDAAKEDQLMERDSENTARPDSENDEKPDGETGYSFKTNKIKIQQNRYKDDLDHTYTADYVSRPFRDLVKCFFDSAETIEAYALRLRMAAYHSYMSEDPEAVVTVGIRSFKQLIRRMKKGAVRNPHAYFYRICDNKFYEYAMEKLNEGFNQALDKGRIPENHWLLRDGSST